MTGVPDLVFRPEVVVAAERYLEARGRSSGRLDAMVVRSNFNVRGRLTLYLFERRARRPSFVLKIARTRRAKEILAAEGRAFEHLLLRSEFLRRQKPRIYGSEGDLVLLLEEFVDGGSVSQLRERSGYEMMVLDWLRQFQSTSEGRTLGKVDLLARLAGLRGTDECEPYRGLVDAAAARVERADPFAIAEVPVHGDFTPANILLDRNGLYVTDWEWLRPAGWPLEDPWWFLLVSGKRGATGAGDGVPGHLAETLVGGSASSGQLRRVAREFAAMRHVPQDLVAVFALIALLDMTVRWRSERIDWQTAPTAAYERALRGVMERERAFWNWWNDDTR